MSTHTLISPKPAAATIKVNGVVITPEAVAAEAQHHPSTRPEAAWKAAAEALVLKEALLQSARHHNVEIGAGKSEDGVETTEEDQLIESYLDSKVTTPEPSEEESRRYYENNRAKLRSPDIFEPSHILLQADPEDEPAFNRARNEAEALIEHLQRRPGKFERMARDRSDCTSSTEGGHLGQVSTGQTTPAFERHAQSQTGAIVRSTGGNSIRFSRLAPRPVSGRLHTRFRAGPPARRRVPARCLLAPCGCPICFTRGR